MKEPRVLGITGWSGSGKTTLLVKLIPLLKGLGLKLATLKHAHHEFDVDTPGKDSYEHRKAGASEVIICSSRRWVQMHELDGEGEPSLGQLLKLVSPCDLILVEGFKREPHPKLEVYRRAIGKLPLYPGDPRVLAVATDEPLLGNHPRRIDLNDIEAVATAVQELAEPLPQVLQLLD